MKRQDDCRVALKTQAVAALSDTPEVGHRWSEEAETLTLEIPRIEPDGFDVAVTASKSEILVIAGRMHSHFDWQSTAEEACIDALGLVRDLLSPGMRLVETSAGGRPYRWDLEVFDDGRWRLEESCGLLLYKLLWPTQYPGAPEHPPAVAIRCLAWNCCCPRRRRGQL